MRKTLDVGRMVGKSNKEFIDLLDTTKKEILKVTGLDSENYSRMNARQLEQIFEIIDKNYIGSFLKTNYRSGFCFEMSNRLTSSAANIRYKIASCDFLVKVSNPIMNAFTDTAEVNGLMCNSRLECLISVLQHELCHAIEVINYGRSDHGRTFKAIANRLFGHTEVFHRMDTEKRKRVSTVSSSDTNIRRGDTVTFEHKGVTVKGYVERIVKRATVRTADERKFYVPLNCLRKV